jgi:3-oxoacyl-[acyl-carrier protein] reductase
MFDLDGRTALVTGAGQNVGAGIARCLAEHGAAVAVNDVVEDRAVAVVDGICRSGANAVTAAFDVTDHKAVTAGIAKAQAALGPIDILVNNAGIPSSMRIERFRDMDPESWRASIDLNLYGVLHCTKAVLDGMCERRWGRVVTISSGAAVVGAQLGISLYGAGKGAALSFMRHLAMEVARKGVTANCLTLGLMASAQGADALDAIAASIPVGRLGTPQDIGAAVIWLASDEASWVTGQTIGVNGGSFGS